jgi:hypothetical protein
MSRLRVLFLLSLATLCAPAFGANPAGPGTVNYIEGSANLAGQALTPRSVGSTTIEPGQSLTTGHGKAEVLLTPGVFLRLDDDSAVKMVSPDLTYTVFDLERGRAMVEVDDIYPQNDIQIVDHGFHTELLKNGLYEFDANNGETMVFDGKEAVQKSENRWVVVKGKHELALATGELGKPHKFDVSAHEDELYNWSSLRSEYLSEANSQIAGEYAGAPAFAPGWFWDPYMWDYTFIGAGPFWSPFGWGFYPRWYFGYGGVFYGRHGFAGRGYPRRGFHSMSNGFHGGEGFHGGGFHSMGGGFHGGGGFGGGGHR